MSVITEIDEILGLYSLPIDKLIKISSGITKQNFNDEVEFCSIISAKTGKCSENCKYCAQSSHYRSNIYSHPLLEIDEIRQAAIESKNNGANRFSIVTSGRTLDGKDLSNIARIIENLTDIEGLSICASLGFLDEKQIITLKNAGLKRYHHNLNSCKSYYTEVCTTHTYDERMKTITLAKSHGLELCVGGIIGMGESRRQRAELAVEISEVNPDSVPLNFLHPIEGTPFGHYHDKIDEDEIIRTIAIFRIMLPKINLRYAGGRLSRLSKEYQNLGLKAGINGVLIGNYLTTIGISPDEDKKLIENNGLRLAQ